MVKKKPQLKRTAIKPDIAFERLQRAILIGELKQGEVVREKRLAAEWGISRTPMRQAVQRAAEAGYLVLKPNRSATVRQFTLDDIRQIYDLRELLECYALELAWPNFRKADFARLRKLQKVILPLKDMQKRLDAQFTFDRELHGLWISKSDNPWLIAALERLLIYRPNLSELLKRYPQVPEKAFQDHTQIIQAMEEGDLKRTKTLLKRHIRKSGEMIYKFFILHEKAKAEKGKTARRSRTSM